MPTSFSEALAPLANHMPRGVRDIEILRVSAHLDGSDFFGTAEPARKSALVWCQKRVGRDLPNAAWEFQDFEILAGGRNSTAVRIADDTFDLWALRAEDPDSQVAGRVWSTEIVIGGKLNERPRVSLRLVVSTAEPKFSIEPHVPGPILMMVGAPGLVRGARKIQFEPVKIQTENDAKDLCDHLEDPERRLPIFVVALSQGEDGKPLIDDQLLAKATAGLARTVRITADLTWVLTNRFGKKHSVFNGGVRAYMKDFNINDDPYRHRLFLEVGLRDDKGASDCVRHLRALAAETSISETRLGKDVLDFAFVRTASRKLKKHDLIKHAAPDAELLKTVEELVESLEKQIEEKDKEIDSFIAEVESAEDRVMAAEQENRSLLFQIRQLKEVLAQDSTTQIAELTLPASWAEFTDWLDRTYPDKILLTPAARRMVRSPEFEDVTLVARSISWLATTQHKRRIDGGGSLRDIKVEDGIRNTHCGGDAYSVNWKGRCYDVDWHIKTGGNVRDPKRCLRIYYFWEPETQQTVVDHLPSHRRTRAT